MVPHLATALTGPLQDLERRILDRMPEIEHWLRAKWQEHEVPFYASVDLRNAGFKLAPVDTNLFPGGFNNLNPAFLPLCVQAMQAAVVRARPDARGVLLVPENHTRNTFYLANVAALEGIIRQAGLHVRIGSLLPDLAAPMPIDLPGGGRVVLEPLVREGRRVGVAGFDPCVVLLNNDLSAGIPPVLEGLHEQYLLPPLHAGWAVRRKTHHFQAYEEVAKKFSKLMGMDPWLINPMYTRCGEVNFSEGSGIECVQSNVDTLLGKIRRKYKEYGINEKPFVIVKADNGTYGMGIMTVRDAKQLEEINRRTRNKMSVIKDGQEVTEVIIQEGVPTYERINEAVAEPVVYMLDRYVVGGFYRVHADRGIDENLNSPGAQFVPLAFAESNHLPRQGAKPGASAPNRFYMYGVVARLAMLAASYELEATDPDAEVYD